MEENHELVDFIVTARAYKTTLTKKYKERTQWELPVEGEVKSLLPGTVISINVKVGQKVKKGDLLLIHEAMKMQNRILAPINGVISSIDVQVGERIPKSHLMVTIK